MNARYRKQMRLRSRHARRGHTPWCNCPEQWFRLFLALKRYQEKAGALIRDRPHGVPAIIERCPADYDRSHWGE